MALHSPFSIQAVSHHHPSTLRDKIEARIGTFSRPLLSHQIMQGPPLSKKHQSDQDTAATLGLLDLDLGKPVSEQSAPDSRSKMAGPRVQQVLHTVKPSKQASIPWRPNPQAPYCQTLTNPPTGTGIQYLTVPLANYEALSPNHAYDGGTVNPRARQSVSFAGKVPLSPRIDESRRYSTVASARAAPSKGKPPKPRGRRFGTPPSLPTSTSQTARRQSPGAAVQGPPAPIPDNSYIAQSAVATMKLSFPQPLLLVLDLNGTLLFRSRASSVYKPRPFLGPFLAHCISTYNVLIWSSATPQNVTAICSQIFKPKQRQMLLGEWARDTLDLTPKQYQAKVQVFKRLDRIWSIDRIQRTHPDFGKGQRWGQWNTLLLDDSVLKASAQPYNAVVVPAFTKEGVTREAGGTDILSQVVAYLETARTFGDVSSFVRERPFQISDGWRWDWAQARTPWVEEGSESDEESGGVRI
ncbi:MAG: hypothetical protein Q9186_006920 [Xanthomendoza sp. 1 TL-2023]